MFMALQSIWFATFRRVMGGSRYIGQIAASTHNGGAYVHFRRGVHNIVSSRGNTQFSPTHTRATDPDENDCLTPGHFLIGQPLLAVPETDVPAAPRNLLNRWKLVNQCAQSFWRRWRDEYLHTLQSRLKWTKDSNNIEVNDMVVIKDPYSPPLK